MPYKDPVKRKDYQKGYWPGWYEKNKEKFKKQVATLNRKKRKEIREKLNKYKKEKGCEKCSENFPYCLEFHHTTPNKEYEIGQALRLRMSWKSILKEINKCTLLCANCHRKLHFSVKK